MQSNTKSEFKTRLADMRRQRVSDMIAQIKILPTTVRVPMRLLELQRKKTSTLREIAETLMADPTLVGQTLALANSAWFSPARPVTKVSDAISLIGISNLMPMVFSTSLAGVFNAVALPQQQRDELWRICLFKAVVAREFAVMRKLERAEDAFICALLQDIAIPAMLMSDPGAGYELNSVLDLSPPESLEREAGLYGGTHAEFGGKIAWTIGLPGPLSEAIATHHDPDGPKLTEELAQLAPALQLAAWVPHIMPKMGNPAPPKQAVTALIGSTPTELKELVTRANAQYELILQTMPDTSDTQFKAFLQQVCVQITGAVTHAIGQSAKIIDQMDDEVRVLQAKAVKADYDALSGVLNRSGFMARAQQLMAAIRKNRCICGVGFADLDNFKRVNDQFGHDVGDLAIIALGKRLREVLTKRGLPGRFGGDEFVFIVTARTAGEQEETARLLEKNISQFQVPNGAKPIPVTASVGIRWLGVPSPEETIETALSKADELMYQAKRAGKARCIVAQAA